MPGENPASTKRKYCRSRLIFFIKCLIIWNLNFSVSLTSDVICKLCVFLLSPLLVLRGFEFRHPFREMNWHHNICHFRGDFCHCILVMLYEILFCIQILFKIWLLLSANQLLSETSLSCDCICWKILMVGYSSRHYVNQVAAAKPCSWRHSVLEIQFLMQNWDYPVQETGLIGPLESSKMKSENFFNIFFVVLNYQ